MKLEDAVKVANSIQEPPLASFIDSWQQFLTAFATRIEKDTLLKAAKYLDDAPEPDGFDLALRLTDIAKQGGFK